MEKQRLHKRVIFYISLYVSLAVISIVFITTSFVIKNEFLQKLTATLLILWLPLIFATILTHLPQTIAGNLFMYMKIADIDKREEKFLTYSSGEFSQSVIFDELLKSPDFCKIKTVNICRDKKEKGDKTQYFNVILKDGRSYKVSVVKRNKQREARYTTTYVVSDIVLLNENKKQRKRRLFAESQFGKAVENTDSNQQPSDIAAGQTDEITSIAVSTDVLTETETVATVAAENETTETSIPADTSESETENSTVITENSENQTESATVITENAESEAPAINVQKKNKAKNKRK